MRIQLEIKHIIVKETHNLKAKQRSKALWQISFH